MPGETINSTFLTGYVLTTLDTNPVVFAPTNIIQSTGSSALTANFAYNWSIQNAGTIQVVSGTAGSAAIALDNAVLTNAGSGRIAGFSAGIYIAGAGTVSNQGTISSSQNTGSGYTYSTIDNTATIVSAAVILGHGSVTNAASALISGGLGGIGIDGDGSVTNAGSVIGGQFGVFIEGGGNLSNATTGTIGGSIYGVYGGVAGPLSVVNQGRIAASTGRGIELLGGGSVTNTGSGTISAPLYGIRADLSVATIVNAGVVNGTSRAGAIFRVGGSLTNAVGGTITGSIAGFAAVGALATTVTNAGSLGGYNFGAVIYSANAQFTNSGSVSSVKLGSGSVFGGAGVALKAGGTVTNASGGHITARWIGVQIGQRTTTVGGTLVNQGSIFASDGVNGAAVWIHGPAYISNSSSGTINGGPFAVVAYYGTTLINSGSIGGTAYAFDAINPGYANRVVVNPGGVFTGIVKGGNSIGSTVVSTLELGSGAASGTLGGIGTQFVQFGRVTVDAGASWTLTGANTIVAGATLTDSGTVTNIGSLSGGIVLDGGVVTNASGATISASFAAVYGPPGTGGGTIVNAGLLAGPATGFGAGIALFSGGTITNLSTGTIAGSEGIYVIATSTAANMSALFNYGAILATEHQGVELDDGGSVTNAVGATIAGAYNGVSIQFQNTASQSAIVVNRGLIVGTAGYGVQLKSAGTNLLTNAAGGIIRGGQAGLYVGAGGTVVNAGTIAISGTGTGTAAAVFREGAANRLVVVPGAVFTGSVDGGNTIGSRIASTLELGSGASTGTFSGLGTQFTDFAQVTVDAGASWAFSGPNTVVAGSYLTDSGTLTNLGTIVGVVQLAGGTVVNVSGATMSGSPAAVYGAAGGAAGTVVNAGIALGGNNPTRSAGIALLSGGFVSNASSGSVAATGTGIYIGTAGTILNAGTVMGTGTHSTGIAISGVAQLTNVAGGTISGADNAVNLDSTGIVLNQGLMQATGSNARAVYFGLGGALSNTGTILSTGVGITFGGSSTTGGTVTNAGTISAATQAIVFAPGQDNRLILVPGFSQTGTAEGNNAVGSTAVSTLELASAASTGRLSGLGTTFRNFAQVAVDTGAAWTFAGTNTLGTGATLTNAGTIFANGVLTDNGLLNSNNGTVIVGSTAGTNGTLLVNTGGTLDIGVAGTVPAMIIGNGAASGTLLPSTGTVIVSGANAVLNSYAPIQIGRANGASGLLAFAQGAQGQVATSTETIQAAIGVGLNGPGTLLVTDFGTTLTAKGQVVIGRAGSGTLLVGNRGSLVLANDGSGNNPSLQIGLGQGTNAAQTGGSGFASITGGGVIDGGTTNSVIQIGGNGDNGTLIFNGGSMQAGFLKLGATSTISGTAYTGSGAITLGTGDLVGIFGTASPSIVLGQGAGGTGTVAINGGTLIGAGQFLIGNQNASGGILTIGTLGTLTTHGLTNAQASGSNGTIVVNGGSLRDNGSLLVGQSGTGYMTVSGGGTVLVNQGTGPAIDIGGNTGGLGTVVVTGALSALMDSGQFIVGDVGTGLLDVNNNALVDAGSSFFNIGNQNGGNGTVSVGGGATLFAGNMNLATPGSGTSSARLAIGAGGSVGVTALSVGGGGTVTLGGSVAAVLSDSGFLTIGQSGTTGALLAIGQGGTATFGSGTIGAMQIGFGNGSSGTVTVNGGTLSGTQLSIAASGTGSSTGILTVGAGGSVALTGLTEGAGGIMTVGGTAETTGGRAVVTDSGFFSIGQTGSGSAALTVNQFGTVSNTGTQTFAIAINSGNSGTVTVNGGVLNAGALNIATPFTGTATGLLTVNAGGLVTASNLFEGGGGTIIVGGTTGALGVLTASGGIGIGQSGTGALLTVDQFGSVVGGGLSIGSGTVSIVNGGIVNTGTSSIDVGSQSSSHGTVSLSGGNAKLIGGVLGIAATGGGSATGLLSIGLGGTVAVTGVNIGNGGTIALSGGLLDPPASISIDAGGTIIGFGTIDGSLINGGLVIASGGLLDITGSIGGSGGLSIAAGATLALDGSVASTETISFTPTDGTIAGGVLQIGTSGFLGTIGAFLNRDSLIVTGIADVSSVAATGNVLTIHQTVGPDILLNLASGYNYAASTFSYFVSGGNTYITDDIVPCYLAGTPILTDRGEIAVEALTIGDRVVTLDGSAKPIKWIGKRAYSSAFAAGNRDIIPIRIARGALGENLPVRDLFVSPLHAMYIDGVLIQAQHLVNGASVVRCPEIDPIRYFHIELENHDVIFASGAPAETFIDCDSRGMFHNATEFAALYPDAAPRAWTFCAPRIDSGAVFDKIRRDIDARAGLAGAGVGSLEGNLDGLDGTTIAGWAFSPQQPDAPVTLEILDGEGLIARVVANRFRPDLESAGIGDGRHGFELRLARALSPTIRHELRVRRVEDGQELPGSPLTIEPSDRRALVKDVRRTVEIAAATADDTGTLDALLATFQSSIDHVRRLRVTQRPDASDDERLVRWAQGPRQQAQRVLIVADKLPRRDTDGPLLSHIAALRGLGWAIEFVASAELARGEAAAAGLKAWGVTCHRAPQVASVEEVLRRKRNDYDMVYIADTDNTRVYAPLARIWQAKARVVACIDDIGPATLSAMRMVDATIVHTSDNADRLRAMAPGANIHIVPWVAQALVGAAKKRRFQGIGFIGQQGAAWFADTVMPLVWARDPDIACVFAGPGRPGDPRIQFVPDTDTMLGIVRATAAIGPNSLILDSFAAGVPSVLTPAAATSLSLSKPLHKTIVETEADMADMLCDIYHQPALHGRFARAGLALVRNCYTEAAAEAAMAVAVGSGSSRVGARLARAG